MKEFHDEVKQRVIGNSGCSGTATHRFRAECPEDATKLLEAIIYDSESLMQFTQHTATVLGDPPVTDAGEAGVDGIMIFGAEGVAAREAIAMLSNSSSDDEIKEASQMARDARFYFNIKQVPTDARHPLSNGNVVEWTAPEFEIETDLTLDAIRKFMKKVDDGHVMVESLNFADKYTGERWYKEN